MASEHYGPNDEKNGSGQGWQYNNHGGGSHNSSHPPAKHSGTKWWHWVIMAIFWLSGAWPLGLIMLIWNLSRVTKQQKEKFSQDVRRAASDVGDAVRREVDNAKKAGAASKNTGGKASSASAGNASQPRGSAAGSKAAPAKKPKGGNGLIAGGAVLTAIFGISTVGALAEFLESLAYGYFFSDELVGVIVLAMFLAAGILMLGKGIGNRRRRERYINYLAYIGANREVDLARMAASFGISVKKLCKDLRRMLSDHILPTGYLDLAAGKLFLTEMGYRAPEPEAPAKAAPEEQAQQEDEILREIRQINDAIPDEAMSAKIDRIEEITGKILAYQKAHPDRSSQLRSFLNYYLPTTLKILRAYAQLDAQGIEGENISAAKARVEGMMDQVVAGFEKQLDKLFQDQAMDISSDIQVLENMLKKDGLSDDQQNMTLPL